MRSFSCTFAVTLLLACLGPDAGAADIWVSPQGSDTNPGTRERPLATPAMALRVAREWRRVGSAEAANGISILFRGGEYALVEPIFVRPEDGGTSERPLRLAAAAGESPVFTGGVRIGGWRPAGPGWPAGVHVARLPLFNGRTLEFRQMWVGNRKAVRARTPNGDGMARLTRWDRPRRVAGIPNDVPVPADLHGVEMVLLQAWEIAVLRLKHHERGTDDATVTFHEPESRVEFEHPWPPPPMPGTDGKNAPFFLANSRTFLDEPGEWFADLTEGNVYYWPRAGEDLAAVDVVAPAVETLVRVAGSLDRPVRHVVFEGLTFAHTTWLRPSLAGHVPHQAGFFMLDAYGLQPRGTPDWRGLDNQAWLGRPPAAAYVRGARDVAFRGCDFRHLGASGVDLHLGVQDSSVDATQFRDVGINGIVVGTFGEEGIEAHLPYDPADEREITARVRVADNVLTDTANEDWGGVAIIAGFVRDTTIEHNQVDRTSYTAISLGWGWTRTANAMRNNRVHANRLSNASTRTADSAGIYTQSNQPGTVVSENVVEAVTISPWVHDREHWFYLYTDEGSSFVTVRDNWVAAEKFLQNATGPGNTWTNNGPHVDDAIRRAAGPRAEVLTRWRGGTPK